MKLRKWLLISAIVMGSLSSVTSFAEVFDQAGDIAEGKPFFFNEHPGAIASYYKDGTSGRVKFTCVLIGENPKAFLYPGKNFENNPVAALEWGTNGPYTWTLADTGQKNGNIKIQLLEGKSAVVQCKEVA